MRLELHGPKLSLKVTPHMDGYALRDLGTEEVMGAFPDMFGALAARDAAQSAAREALAQLAACLAKARA